MWKVQKIFDEQIYAVKQVRFKSKYVFVFISSLNVDDQAMLENARGEVVTLSSLHHKHIVGYYTAWVEQE